MMSPPSSPVAAVMAPPAAPAAVALFPSTVATGGCPHRSHKASAPPLLATAADGDGDGDSDGDGDGDAPPCPSAVASPPSLTGPPAFSPFPFPTALRAFPPGTAAAFAARAPSPPPPRHLPCLPHDALTLVMAALLAATATAATDDTDRPSGGAHGGAYDRHARAGDLHRAGVGSSPAATVVSAAVWRATCPAAGVSRGWRDAFYAAVGGLDVNVPLVVGGNDGGATRWVRGGGGGAGAHRGRDVVGGLARLLSLLPHLRTLRLPAAVVVPPPLPSWSGGGAARAAVSAMHAAAAAAAGDAEAIAAAAAARLVAAATGVGGGSGGGGGRRLALFGWGPALLPPSALRALSAAPLRVLAVGRLAGAWPGPEEALASLLAGVGGGLVELALSPHIGPLHRASPLGGTPLPRLAALSIHTRLTGGAGTALLAGLPSTCPALTALTLDDAGNDYAATAGWYGRLPRLPRLRVFSVVSGGGAAGPGTTTNDGLVAWALRHGGLSDLRLPLTSPAVDGVLRAAAAGRGCGAVPGAAAAAASTAADGGGGSGGGGGSEGGRVGLPAHLSMGSIEPLSPLLLAGLPDVVDLSVSVMAFPHSLAHEMVRLPRLRRLAVTHRQPWRDPLTPAAVAGMGTLGGLSRLALADFWYFPGALVALVVAAAAPAATASGGPPRAVALVLSATDGEREGGDGGVGGGCGDPDEGGRRWWVDRAAATRVRPLRVAVAEAAAAGELQGASHLTVELSTWAAA
ncbi:hypothetical protein I4F81_001582 [Pyropia yezoensis]|uniref:Uncharacterized protein n=1 Tax=Pyropia yezoensis TaxID=2788 RepID=A0ACC3BM40_PYRYE|nr:hypothetical protein I4F81_001582 [Neopyropia yezoensis]